MCVCMSPNECEKQNFFATRNLAHSRLFACLRRKNMPIQIATLHSNLLLGSAPARAPDPWRQTCHGALFSSRSANTQSTSHSSARIEPTQPESNAGARGAPDRLTKALDHSDQPIRAGPRLAKLIGRCIDTSRTRMDVLIVGS